MTYGYVRVSSKDQNEARQVKQMEALGIGNECIFLDKESGKDFSRPQYQRMIGLLQEGDLVYISSLDRLGRNYDEMGAEWNRITNELGADIVVLDMPLLDTRVRNDLTGKLIADIVFKLLSYVAENERAKIRTRQAEGIAIAKAEGKYKGRKPLTVDRAAFESVYSEVVRGACTNRAAMEQLGLKPNTYYRFVREFKTGTGLWAA